MGRWGRVLEERRRKEWLFSKATRKTKSETLKCFYSRERKRFLDASHYVTGCNGQILDIYPINLQTKFQEDPTVNEQLRQLP